MSQVKIFFIFSYPSAGSQLLGQTRSYLLRSGRHHPALGSPTLGRKEPPLAVASGPEHGPNQAQYSAVRYALGHEREEFFVIDGPEEISEVRVYDPLRPALHLLPHLAQGVLRRSPSPKSEASVIEYRLEDGLEPIE